MTDSLHIDYYPEDGENAWEQDAMIQEVMAQEGVRGYVSLSSVIPELLEDLGISRLPALVINNEVVIEGRPPTQADLILWFDMNVPEEDRGPRQNPDHKGWPQSVSEAVNWLIEGLSDDDRECLAKASDEQLISLVSFPGGMGQGIRNGYGLWAGNKQLLDDCGTQNADDASWIILKALRQELNRHRTIGIYIEVVSIELDGPNREAARLESIIDQEAVEAFVITAAYLPEILQSWGVQQLPVFRINGVTVWEGENPPADLVKSWLNWPKTLNEAVDRLSTIITDNTLDDPHAHYVICNNFGLLGANKELLRSCGSETIGEATFFL